MAKPPQPTWIPGPADFGGLLQDHNPWLATGKVPDAWALPVERPLTKSLVSRIASNVPRRFQLILGPRRVGKTTSMYQAIRTLLERGVDRRNLWWLRLDHPLLMPLSLGSMVKSLLDSDRHSHEQPAYIFLDELTYAREWDLWLKTFYDEQWPIRLIGTSSATAALRGRTLESGVGRWEEQYLAPYLLSEYLELLEKRPQIPVGATLFETLQACVASPPDLTGIAEVRRRLLLTGGFPELLLSYDRQVPLDEETALLQSQRTLRNDAVERAIYKDIPQAFGIQSPLVLERLLYTLAGQVTGILSPQSICSTLDGMGQVTFDRYLAYLERAFLVFTLPNYSGNEAAIQKRGRKLYFVDAAVRNAALQRGIAPLSNEREMGLLIENMVAGHLHALSKQSQVRLFHWREKQDEVDLVYAHPTSPLACEVASAGGHSRKGLYAFAAKYPQFRGRCFLLSPTAVPRMPQAGADHEVGQLPLDLFLLAVSAQAAQELEHNLQAR